MEKQKEWTVEEAVTALRESDISAYRLSKITGLSPMTIAAYRVGRSVPKPDMARRIGNKLEKYQIEQEREKALPEPVKPTPWPAKDSMLNTALETIKLQMQENAQMREEMRALTTETAEALNFYKELIIQARRNPDILKFIDFDETINDS